MSEPVSSTPVEGQAPPEGRAPLSWGTPAQFLRQLGITAAILVGWGLVLGVVLAPQREPPVADVMPGQELTWDEHIYPVMQRHCVLCHGTSGGLTLTSYEQALAGGVNGAVIVPGDAANSLLYRLLLGPADGLPAMPFGGAPLPQETIDLIGAWIDQLEPAP